MTKKSKSDPNLVVYQSKSGALELRADIKNDTIWLTQQQVADLFDVQKAAISKHVKNIFDNAELDRKATVSKMETVQKEGNREIKRTIEHYNLDLVLSIGYRVNSKQATFFRQWATKKLKQYIIEGYAINRHRIKVNYDGFLKSLEEVKNLLPPNSAVDHGSILELITMFADTWMSLDAYDKDKLTTQGKTKRKVRLTAIKLNKALLNLKQALINKKEATDIFGVERTKDSIAGIIGNVMQSFGDQDVYDSVEEKAAHLLYFIVKNHPFIDGNKRSGAYAFIWFLQQTRVLDVSRITPPALTAITLLIAESNAKDKDKMIGLVCSILSKRRAG